MPPKDCPSHSGLLLVLERIETNIAKIETGVAGINGRVREGEILNEGQNKLIDQNHDEIDDVKKQLDNRMSPGKAVGIWATIVTVLMGLLTWLRPWAGK